MAAVRSAKAPKEGAAQRATTSENAHIRSAASFVGQVITGVAFSLGAPRSWDITALESYALGLIAMSEPSTDTVERVWQIIHRNHVSIYLGHVHKAVLSLHKRRLVKKRVLKGVTTRFGGPAESYTLSAEGWRALRSVADNLRSDLRHLDATVQAGLNEL